jgi:hypothetical protein
VDFGVVDREHEPPSGILLMCATRILIISAPSARVCGYGAVR